VGEVSRIAVEITTRGGLSIRLDRVPDRPFPDPAGTRVELSGFPGAKVFDDDDFFFIDIDCDDASAVSVLGTEGLEVRQNNLVVDTGVGKDGIGSRNFLRTTRSHALPFSLQMDNVRQGDSTTNSPSHGGRSMNYNFGIFTRGGQLLSHAFLTVQPTDPYYTQGKVFLSLKKPNDELREVAQQDIREGRATIRVLIPGISEDAKVQWWCVVRGDPARIARMRTASPLLPSFGAQLEGGGGHVGVKHVIEKSPADRAGLKDGDALVSINGQRVRDAESVLETIAEMRIGDEITVVAKRAGRQIEVKTRLD